MATHFEKIGKQAEPARNIDLVAVLKQSAAIVDKNDRSKWHTPQGVISVTGHKFFNWTKAIGGGGAIDLIMHLYACDFIGAVRWLTENFSSHIMPTSRSPKPQAVSPLALPINNPDKLPQVTRYLTRERSLPAAILRSLIDAGNLYADDTGDALARKMLTLYPTIQRLRPNHHDWNDELKSSL